jgi:hypothetical protein
LLLGGWSAVAIVLGTPSLFLATGALLLWVGLKRERPWVGALGLCFLAFRAEWVLWILLGLIWRRHIKLVLVAAVLTGALWIGADLFWGPGLGEAWLASLQSPPSGVEPGVGLVGLLPGQSEWISIWWFAYGMSGAIALWAWSRLEAHQAMAFSLAVALLFSPQLSLGDLALLAPLFLAFFPHPERPALVAGLGCYLFLFLGVPGLMALLVLFLLYSAFQNAQQAPISEVS